MDYFINILIVVSIPLFFYFAIAYANRRFRRMDQELERRAEAAALTTTELQTLVWEAVAESVAELAARTERNERRIDEVEKLLGQPQRAVETDSDDSASRHRRRDP